MRQKTLVLALLAGFAAGSSWGQQTDIAGPAPVRDYDARDIEGAPAVQQARALVEQRTAGMRSFVAAETAARPGTRIAPNRYGLPKLLVRDGAPLAGPSTAAPEEIARTYLRTHAGIFPFSSREVDNLRLVVRDVADRATFLVFNQTIEGIDVFEGQIKFTLSRTGEVVQVASGEVAPGLRVSATPKLSPEEAVRAAYKAIQEQSPAAFTAAPAPNGGAAFLNPRGARYNPITAELSIFPLAATSARLAYRVYLDFDSQRSYEILVDAGDGSLLYLHNLTLNEAQGRVWRESPMAGSRELVAFPTSQSGASPDPWLPTDSPIALGNNVDAYLDADGDDAPDPTTAPDLYYGHAYSPGQLFDFEFGDGTGKLDPRNYQAAAVTNLFYFINAAHDYYYSLGFTEAAKNFQTDNYGRGGVGNDAVTAEGQSGGMPNNAAFSPTLEGTPPHIRMGIFTRGTTDPKDDLDSDYDGQVVFHEYAHGVSTRLVGGGTSMSCLSRTQSGALGEGWSDYFSISRFNNPVEGAYVTQDTVRGVRRFSYEGYPYTYEDFGNAGYEVHNNGEIWAATLWDLRKALGQEIADKLVMDGIKSTPCNPSMTNGRDAILSADLAANGGANRAAIWQVFAKHGLGYSALGVDGQMGSTGGTRYDAAYNMPPDLGGPPSPAVTSDPLAVESTPGQPYSYVIAATNPNGGVLNYAIAQGPADMTIDQATGKVNWIVSFTGKQIKIVVTDGKGGRVVHGYWLPEGIAHLALGVPLIVSGEAGSGGQADVTIPEGVPVLQVTFRDSSSAVRLYVAGVGIGVMEGSREPTVSLVEPAAGKWNVLVFNGSTPYERASLTAASITPTPIGVDSITTGLSGSYTSETFYRVSVPPGTPSLTVSTSGGTSDLDLYLRKGGPPAFYKYDLASMKPGSTESIIVQNPDPGDWYICLRAHFSAYSGVTLAVSTTPAPDDALSIITPRTLPSAVYGAFYSQTLTAVHGVPPYHWSMAYSLPAGLSLSSDGVVSGIPAYTGNLWFAVAVTDSAPAPATVIAGFYLTVTPFSLITSDLRRGFVGGKYSQTLEPNGPSIVWTLTPGSGALPDGLTLLPEGVISGVPSKAGFFHFALQACMGSSPCASRFYNITIIQTALLTRVGILPHVAVGAGWTSEIWIVNDSDNAYVPVRLCFHGDDGAVGFRDSNWIPRKVMLKVNMAGSTTVVEAGDLNQVLASHSVMIVTAESADAAVQGWVDVQSTVPLKGFNIFRSDTLGEGIAPLQPQASSSTLILPFDNTTGQFLEGVALANSSATAVPITATVWDASGNLLASGQTVHFKALDAGHKSAVWPASGHDGFMLPDLLPMTAGTRGVVQFTAPQGALGGVGLRVNIAHSTFTSLPVTTQ